MESRVRINGGKCRRAVAFLSLPAQELLKFLISKTKTAASVKHWRPFWLENSGRGERIRTSGLYVPNANLCLTRAGFA
jgi:hypothetical protein